MSTYPEFQAHERLKLESEVLAASSDKEDPDLTGVGYRNKSWERKPEQRSKSSDAAAVTGRSAAIARRIRAAVDHGDITVGEDGTIKVNTEYLHPDLIAACRFREGDYSNRIQRPEQDGIFISEFGIAVRKEAIASVAKNGIFDKPEINAKVVDAVLYITRMIVAKILEKDRLYEKLKRRIEKSTSEEDRTFYDNSDGYEQRVITQRKFTMKTAGAQKKALRPRKVA